MSAAPEPSRRRSVSGSAQPILQHDADHAKRRAPQRIGVLAAGRLLVDRPEADERVELVGERDRDRNRRRRNAVVRPLRLVVVFDRRGDARLLALGGRVIATHQPLQLRELADHFGREVGLGEMRRARRKLSVRADLRRKLARQRLDALDPLALRPELLVKDDEVKFLQPLVERLRGLVLRVRQGREIGPPEMARVGEARAHDAAVAGRDRRAVVGGDEVRDEDELVGELAGAFSRVMAGLVPAIHAVPRRGSVRFRA